MAGTYEQAKVGDPNSSAGPKWVAQFLGMNEMLNSENDVTTENIAKGTLGRFYAPTIVATEQERESASFGTLTTKDEVTNVVLPANGLIVVGYAAKVQSSVSAAGRVAIFLGSNQLKDPAAGAVTETSTQGTEYNLCTTHPRGLVLAEGTAAFSTTGMPLAAATSVGGPCHIFAEAGTYNISIQFRATSGKIKAKERKLWVGVIGGV